MRALFGAALCVGLLGLGQAFAEDFPKADSPVHEVVDFYINQRIESLKTTPAPLAEDAVLLRRTMLDLVGRPPTAQEAQAYVAASDEEKRRELIERLVGSPGFVRHQAEEFDALLMQGTNGSLRDYLTQAFQENRHWDVMFRELLLGQADDAEQKGSIEFIKRRVSDLDQLTTDTSSILLGVNVSCAQCHNHPFVGEWTQNHYYGMKSFFSRTFDNGGLLGERDYGMVEYKNSKGISHPAQLMFITGKVLDEPEWKEPTDDEKKKEKELLEELKKKKEAPPAPSFSRRAQLVEVAFRSENRELAAKAIVNHVWARLFGMGLVDPVDQMHPENPASVPALLDWLAEDFIAHNYDLQHLIAGLVRSDAYARSSRWDGDNRPPASAFAVATVRPLRPHAYAAVLKFGVAEPDYFSAELKPEDLNNRIDGTANGALGLARSFEQPGPDFQVSIEEALLMSNSDRIRNELLKTGWIAKLASNEDQAAAVESLFWNIFSRPPQPEESQAVAEYLKQRPEELQEAYAQVLWALLTSSECRFNY